MDEMIQKILWILLPVLYISSMESYVIVHERIHMGTFNKTVNKDFVLTMKKFNRTTWAVNYSFTVLEDLDDDIIIHIVIDRLASNEYKHTGLFLKLNGCEFFKKDTFGIASQMRAHGNIVDVCHLVKGKYYMINLIPDTTKFPKTLPPGSYRLHIMTLNHDTLLSDSYWYARVVDSY